MTTEPIVQKSPLYYLTLAVMFTGFVAVVLA